MRICRHCDREHAYLCDCGHHHSDHIVACGCRKPGCECLSYSQFLRNPAGKLPFLVAGAAPIHQAEDRR
jgi:hypothetical protein